MIAYVSGYSYRYTYICIADEVYTKATNLAIDVGIVSWWWLLQYLISKVSFLVGLFLDSVLSPAGPPPPRVLCASSCLPTASTHTCRFVAGMSGSN